MSNFSTAYGAKTAITVTLHSLSSVSARESTAIDNSSTKFQDFLIRYKGAAAVSTGSGFIDVYCAASFSDGTYTDGATGVDASFTSTNRQNSPWVHSIKMNSINNVVGVFTVAHAFKGWVPEKLGLIFVNNSGSTTSTSAWTVDYEGLSTTVQ